MRVVVNRITYHNDENGYSILSCCDKNKEKGPSEPFKVVGYIADINAGSELLCEGDWKIDPKYGMQFAATKLEEVLPETKEGIIKYLASGLIKGIGPSYAKRIVDVFGEETFDVLDNNIEALSSVDGIGKKRIERIKKSWADQRAVKNIMLFLQSYNISTTYAIKIYKQYGDESISVLRKNPYCLADDISGIGFKMADKVAENMGVSKDADIRLQSGLLYALSQFSIEGHVYAEKEQLIAKGVELLEASEERLALVLGDMLLSHKLVGKEVVLSSGEQIFAIYLPYYYAAETDAALRLTSLKNSEAADDLYRRIKYERQVKRNVNFNIDVDEIERLTKMKYDEAQAEAIRAAAFAKVMVLTGGPGTGKTTTVNGILKVFSEYELDILLAAPTGRAAKRMSETTDREAITIHRLLEYRPGGFGKNGENPLEGDVLIVDESSMIDIQLMDALLKAIPDNMRLILVGDIDQLPSVGAGNVLRDIIDSNSFTVVRLTKIFRQAQTSQIVMNAHRINKGEYPEITNGKNADFFFIEAETENSSEIIVNLVKNRLSKCYNILPEEIQILTPMKGGPVGTEFLNTELQKALNPESDGIKLKPYVKYGSTIYRLGDKVMQIKNDYDKGVFNGDIGFITKIDLEDSEIVITFDERAVEYDKSDLDEIVHAYAVTIHKSQGSEYPIVVMPITMSHYIMLQRNLLYTAVTRAKKVFVMVGDKKAVVRAVKNMTVNKRNTMLKEWIYRCEQSVAKSS